MLSKCANPACHASFRRLTEGKLFQVETCYPGLPEAADGKRNAQRHTEYYWLCSDCCRNLTLVSSGGRVITTPLPQYPSTSLAAVRKPPLPADPTEYLSAVQGRRYGS
jgi:hypothetical protein